MVARATRAELRVSWRFGASGGEYLKNHLFGVWRVTFNLLLVPVSGSVHLYYDSPARYVLMVHLRRPRNGGNVVFFKGWPTLSWWRFHLYRADLVKHGVTEPYDAHSLFLTVEWTT